MARDQFAVARMYTEGIGTEKDPEKAAEWLGRYAISSLEDPIADAADSAKIIGKRLPLDSYAINLFLCDGFSRRALIQNLTMMLDVPKVKDKEFVYAMAVQAANTAG